MSKDHILLFSVATSTLLVGAILSSTNVTADSDVVSTATISVPQSCTMSGTGMNSHNAEIQSGTYTADIGTTTLHAYCNDSAGFAVYAIGYTDNEFGKNVLTDSTLGSTYDIITGTNTSGSTSNWAVKLAITQDSGDTTGTNAFALDNSFGSYHNVPNTYTKVAHKNTATDMADTTGGVKLTTTYAVLISSTQPAGTYIGQVKYTLVHPASELPLQPQTATSGCINYFPNGSNVVGTMGCQSIGSSDTSATLLAGNFSRDGYGFAGWSDAYDYATNNNAHFYGPQEDITFTAGQYTGTNNGLALYAVWVKSAGSLQDTSKVATLCGTGTGSLTTAPTDGTANLASVSALTDQRDSQTYAIAKLADGKCWMIENLRLESTAAHNSDGTLAQGYGTSATYGNFSGLADAEPAWANNITTANSLYYSGTQDGTATIDIGTGSSPGYRFPRYNNVNTPTTASDRPQNPTANSSTNSTSNAGMYSYGNYYTWAAAIADTTDYSGGDHNTTSICPIGWQIPLGNTSTGDITQGEADAANKVGGFSYLDRKMGGTGAAQYTTPASCWRKYPANFVYSGRISGGSVYNRGGSGFYWSSTTYNVYYAYILSLNSSTIYPGTNYGGADKDNGRSIRCIASS